MKMAINASKKKTLELSKKQDSTRYAHKNCSFQSSVLESLLIPDTEIQANTKAVLPTVSTPFYSAGEITIGDIEYDFKPGKDLLGRELHDFNHLCTLTGTENAATFSASNTTAPEQPIKAHKDISDQHLQNFWKQGNQYQRGRGCRGRGFRGAWMPAGPGRAHVQKPLPTGE